jgi:hypothetical protein
VYRVAVLGFPGPEPGRWLGRDDHRLVAPGQQMLGDAQHTVGHAIHIGGEGFRNDGDPHADTMRRRSQAAGCAVAIGRSVGDIWGVSRDAPLPPNLLACWLTTIGPGLRHYRSCKLWSLITR